MSKVDSGNISIEPDGRSAWVYWLVLTGGYLLLHGALFWAIPRFEPATHNDDWVYVPPAQEFFESGKFKPHPIAAALAMPQIIAGGWLFRAAGEFRYGLLRDVMVLFGILPVWLMGLLFRQLGFPRNQATWGALLLMLNPLTVSLTWSFQTEIPFLTFALAGLVLLLWGEGPQGNRWAIWPACVAMLLMSLTRQTGLCLVVAAVVHLGIRKRWSAAFLVGLLIPITLAIENHFTAEAGLIYLPYAKHVLRARLSAFSAKILFLMLYEGLHLVSFLGVFLLPVVLAGRAASLPRGLLWGCGLVMGGVFFLDGLTGLTPALGPYLRVEPAFSLGPVTLEVPASATVEKTASPTPALFAFRVLAGVGGTVLLAHLVLGLSGVLRAMGLALSSQGNSPEIEQRRQLIVLWIWAAMAGILLTSVVMGRRPFDEYLILALPLSLALVWPRQPWKQPWLSVAVPLSTSLLLGIFAIAGTVDYWCWNAARWQAISRLEADGIDYHAIDGGYAYNGLHANLSLSPEILKFHEERSSTIPENWLKNQRPAKGEFYVVGLSPPGPGQTLVFHVPYSTPLSKSQRHIYVKRSVIQPRKITSKEP